MAKRVLYWTLNKKRYAFGYEVLAVTSEGPRDRINGRFEDGAATHTLQHDCKGRFDTLEAAKNKIAAIEVLVNEQNAKLQPIHDEEIRIIREYDAKIKTELNS